jgi:hypothetical protein
VTALVRSPEAPRPPAQTNSTRLNLQARTLQENLVTAVSGLVLVGAVVLRFCTPAPMWLDEALTVKVSRAPLHENDCQAIASDLAASRSQVNVVAEQGSDTPFEIFEGENLYRYAPAT